MNHEEYKRTALEPIINYIESVMASYSKEELEARIKKALPELKESKESEDEKNERIRKFIVETIFSQYGDSQEYLEVLAYLEKLKEQKPAEWSEEDGRMLSRCIKSVECSKRFANSETYKAAKNVEMNWLKALSERFNLQPKREDEPMEIKFAGKIYKVHGKKDMPGGATGYIIEDEPGHYDCIIHPDEVLGGGYGIKSNGSPYPTKEANFGQPH